MDTYNFLDTQSKSEVNFLVWMIRELEEVAKRVRLALFKTKLRASAIISTILWWLILLTTESRITY